MRRTTKPMTIEELDERIARLRARGVRGGILLGRYLTRRARLLVDAEYAAYRQKREIEIAESARAPGEARQAAGAKADEVVAAFLEMAQELLDVAPAVTEADGRDIGVMLDCLASWFPLVGEDGDGEGDGDADVIAFRPPDGAAV